MIRRDFSPKFLSGAAAAAFVFMGLFLAVPMAARAELKLHSLFTDHAVLQQELPVPVWGWADAGAEVTVTFAGQTETAKAGEDGAWMVTLKPLKVNAEGQMLEAKAGDEMVSCQDVLVGEVWVGSGQSNMAMAVNGTTDAGMVKDEAAAGKYAGISLFKAPIAGEDERQDTVNASWMLPDERNTQVFSATAFYFGRKLQEELGIPVGIIQSANGGTNAFAWINTDTFANDSAAGHARGYWEAAMKTAPAALERYEKAKAAWPEKVKAAKVAGTPVEGIAPREPMHDKHVKRPTGHYNAMIAPLQPYAIRGVIWYQGEGNSRPPFADRYKDLMFALIEDWRADWAARSGGERRDFPFYVVQLPNYGGGDPWGWPLVREQMLQIWQEGKNTGTVVTLDVGEEKDIHPRNKKAVGDRLARFALGDAYEKEGEYSGPIYDGVKFEGGKAVLEFEHEGQGLVSTDGEPLRYFTMAGADGVFHPAEVKIEGDDKVVVTSAEVSEPKAVRYAWLPYPESPNFGNKDGLMASPFRTDTGPVPNPAAEAAAKP